MIQLPLIPEAAMHLPFNDVFESQQRMLAWEMEFNQALAGINSRLEVLA